MEASKTKIGWHGGTAASSSLERETSLFGNQSTTGPSDLFPARPLASRYYTDPVVFEKERAGLFSQTWHFAGHASRLENPGDYFSFEISGECLFCVKGRDGIVRSFYNVCQHRAHQIVRGQGSSSVLVCPYHAWTYELTGELRSGPNIGAVEGFDRSKIRLTRVQTEIFLGFIFVNLDPMARPMDEWFPGARSELSEWVPDWQELKPLEWVEVAENCNWKVSVENYSECYHCSLNHPTFTTGVVRPETYDIQPRGFCLRHSTQSSGSEGLSYGIDASRPHAEEYSSWFLWPMFSFQVYPGNILNTYHWRPVDAGRVVVWRGWFAAGEENASVVRNLAIQDRSTTVEEDIRLVESVQRGLMCRGYNPGPLVVDPKCGVNSEHSIKQLQQWYREAIGEVLNSSPVEKGGREHAP